MAKGRCYLFLGPEIGEKQDALEEIRRSLRAGNSSGGRAADKASFEETSFYVGETPVTGMVAALRNGSLFADARLFLIKNADVIKKKDDIELLASYMKSPQDDTILILITDAIGLEDRLEKAAGSQAKRIFWELFENRKTEWVSAFFRRQGYRITGEGITAILELVENNTDALRRECSRLMLFLGKDNSVDEEDVEKWLAHTREESSRTLFTRIAAGDLPKSIEILHTLLAAKEAPQSILGGLAWSFRTLRSYLAVTAAGAAGEGDFQRIGLASKIRRKDFAAAAKRYASADGPLSLIGEFDLLIRSAGSAPEVILMDLLICKLIVNGDKPRERWYYY
ncbi:MAG: DNA polymerase III subunit delta [Spirochaetaceae bacterium]|jgi:DNA polymerase-3 subunit delta|nr:DNA polymerase III subunit delta [Spirochaetaceae bacterium]